MAGPGGVEVGRISVRVVPDTSKFAADLRADLKRLETSLRLDIPVELDTSGIAEHARAATEEANAAAGTVKIKTEVDQRALRQTNRTLARFSKGMAASIGATLRGATFAGLGLSALGAIPGVLSLAGSLASLSGVVALLPAVVNGAAVAITTLVIGTQGFGKALKDVGNTAKFNADLKKLSPSARAAAQAIKGMLPQFRSLRRTVQESLFKGMSTEIRKLGLTLLPQLKKGLGGIASALNNVAGKAVGAFVEMARSRDIEKSLGFLKKAIDNLAPAMQPLIKAFGQLITIGTSFLPGFARNIATAAQQFGTFIANAAATGQLAGFIQGGIDAFKLLGSIVGSVARVIGGVVKAAQDAGGGSLAAFASLLHSVADVVNSPAFQSGLVTIFAGLQAGAEALAGALPAIAPAFAALAPVVAALATAVGPVLAAALEALAPIIEALAPPLTDFLNALGPQLVKAIQAASPYLTSFFTTLAGNKTLLAIVATLLTALVDPFVGAAVAIGIVAVNFGRVQTFLAPLLPLFSAIGGALAPIIPAFQQLASAIVDRMQAVAPIFQMILGVVQQNLPQIQAIVVQVFSTIASVIVAVLTFIRIQIQNGTDAINFIWRHFGDIITGVVRTAFPAVLQIIKGILNVIQGITRAFTAAMTGDWSGAWHAIEQLARGAGQVLVGIMRADMAVLDGVIAAGLRIAAALFSGLGDRIKTQLGDIGSIFVSVGSDIIAGITSGVVGAAGHLASAVANAIGGALVAAKHKAGIKSPSTVFRDEVGKWISLGIADGVTMHSSAVSTAVIGAVAPPNLSSIGGVAGAGRGGSPLVNVEQMVTHDPDEAARALTGKFTEALTVANLQGALVGV